MSTAILHDQFRTIGGAERVSIEIARALDAPIYVMRADDGVAPDDIDIRNLSTQAGEWLMNRHYLMQDVYQFFAWQHVPELYKYDTIIETKNNPAWFVPHVDSQTIIRYCHSTPRGMYDQFHRRGGDTIGDVLKSVQRLLYQQTVPYADHWMCNSEVVKRRLERYADPASATISTVYPPVETERTNPDRTATQDYYFYIGRLAVNKRIGLLKEVAKAVDVPIVVAGDGPYKDELLQNKPDNLEYIGYISEQDKWDRLSEAKATLMLAENEDFGIVPIESFAAGTPVIGANEGYTKHQIKDEQNGYLCEPTVENVKAAIKAHEIMGVEWTGTQIADFARQFSTDRFHREIKANVEEAKERAAIKPDLSEPVEVMQHD